MKISSAVVGTGLLLALVLAMSAPGANAAGIPSAERPTGNASSSSGSAVPGWAEPVHVFSAPPAGFNPLKASAQQLAAYGFPPKPANAVDLHTWEVAVTGPLDWVPPNPQFAVGSLDSNASASPDSGVTSTNCNGNWAGYEALSSSNGGIQYAFSEANWVQPSVDSNPTYSNSSWDTGAPSVGVWTGVGAASSGEYIQAGVWAASTQTASYRFVTQNYPYQKTVDPEGPVVSPGDSIYVSVSFDPNTYDTNFWLENVTTNKVSSFTNYTPDYSGSAADFIVEYPSVAFSSYFPNFGSVTLTGDEDASYTGSITPINGENVMKDVMTSNGTCSGTALANTGGIDGSIQGFKVSWENS